MRAAACGSQTQENPCHPVSARPLISLRTWFTNIIQHKHNTRRRGRHQGTFLVWSHYDAMWSMAQGSFRCVLIRGTASKIYDLQTQHKAKQILWQNAQLAHLIQQDECYLTKSTLPVTHLSCCTGVCMRICTSVIPECVGPAVHQGLRRTVASGPTQSAEQLRNINVHTYLDWCTGVTNVQGARSLRLVSQTGLDRNVPCTGMCSPSELTARARSSC